MALPILDGNQSATTLSSILTSGEHIPAHTVVSLGTQAITDISGAVSGSVVSISNFPATQTIAGTVTATIRNGEDAILNDAPSGYTVIRALSHWSDDVDSEIKNTSQTNPLPIAGTVTIGSALPAGTNSIGTVTANLSSGTTVNPIYNYILEGDSDLVIGNTNPLPISGTVTANLFGEAVGGSPNEPTKLQCDSNGFLITSLHRSGSDAVNYDPVAGNVSVNVKNVSSVTIGNSVTIGSLPAISGTVTANLTISATAITSGSFASLTSATLVPGNTARKMATVFNLGAGQLFINAGATATTLGGGFMVALSSGDFYECDYTTTTLSAIFATAGTASWMSH
jgi:hypothetical protein